LGANVLPHLRPSGLGDARIYPSETAMKPQTCELCGRTMKMGTTAHHLIPRTCHSNKWFKKQFSREQMQQTVDLCRDCHSTIHRLVPKEKNLGCNYYSLELLRQHPKIASFLGWIKRQT
jgi:hypothetical protein